MTIENGPVGIFFVTDDSGHRTAFRPCLLIDGEWQNTDLSGEPEEIRAHALELWTPEVIAEYQAAYAEAHPAQEPGPYKLYRSTFVERMDPEEAATLEAALLGAEAKLRMMYQSVEYFVSDDPLFAVLHWTVATSLGSEGNPNIARADELLSPAL